MSIFDSVILQGIPFDSTPNRKVVVGSSNLTVGGGSDILISQGSGTQTSTSPTMFMTQYIDFYGDNNRPIFVGLISHKPLDGLIGGQASSVGLGFYQFKLTKETGAIFPRGEMASSSWRPGGGLDSGTLNYLPPSTIWTIDSERGDLTGRRQYGLKVASTVSGIALRVQNIQIMCFSL